MMFGFFIQMPLTTFKMMLLSNARDSHSGDHKQNANTNLIALTDNHKLAGCISGGGF